MTTPRRALPALASTLNAIAPPFVPLAGGATTIQLTWLVALHEQPVSVSTLALTLPPSAETVVFAGVTP